MVLSRAGLSHADNLATIVDRERLAQVSSRQRPEIGHGAIVPEEGVRLSGVGRAVAHDLPTLVDCPCRAGGAAWQGPEVDHRELGMKRQREYG